jgi:predicted RNA-binding Zn-ribbon protein involved in translation (DUF1610 family)
MFRFHRFASVSGLVLGLSALGLAALPVPAAAQTYHTISKHCEKCGGAVSIDSKVGDTCPHCGVVWGGEHTTYSHSTSGSGSAPDSPSARRRAARQSRQRLTAGTCSRCGRAVPPDARVGDSCRFCGVLWSDDERRMVNDDDDDEVPTLLRLPAPPSLAFSVSALLQRRPAALGQLPPAFRRMDRRAFALVLRLPLAAQETYCTALESFPTLDTYSRSRVTAAVQALSLVPDERWNDLAQSVAAPLEYLGRDAGRLKELRRDPVSALMRLKDLADAWVEVR